MYSLFVLAYDIHSVSNLLGRTVHQLVNANIYSVNHVAVTNAYKLADVVKRFSCCSDQMSE